MDFFHIIYLGYEGSYFWKKHLIKIIISTTSRGGLLYILIHHFKKIWEVLVSLQLSVSGLVTFILALSEATRGSDILCWVRLVLIRTCKQHWISYFGSHSSARFRSGSCFRFRCTECLCYDTELSIRIRKYSRSFGQNIRRWLQRCHVG